MSKKRRLLAGLAIFTLCVVVALLVLYLPSPDKPQCFLPPEYDVENQTLDQVKEFIRSDDTDTIPYEEGFNCWDSVFRVYLNARWHGIKSYPIAVVYEESPDEESSGHMVIGFPIGGNRLVLFETQNDQQIGLEVGHDYNGRTVIGFYLLTFTPIPLADSPEYDASMGVK